MKQPALHDLLTCADASAPPPPAMPLLAESVRTRAGARARRRRQAGAVCVLLLVVVGLSVVAFRPPGPSTSPTAQARFPQGSTQPAPVFDAAAAAAEAASLRAEAARRLTVANEAMKRADRRRRLSRAAEALAAATPPPTVGDQRDRAALTLLDHGDRLRRDLKEVDAALAAYRRTIELFPDTKWAAVAKQRIHELRPDARLDRPHHELT